MTKTIVDVGILGNVVTEVLRREINIICLEENINGDEVWKKVAVTKSLDGINVVLNEYFGNKLKIR